MRLRLTNTDLLDLARLYRGDAAHQRWEAQRLSTTSREFEYIEAAKHCDARAKRLEDLAAKGQDFILMPARPFDGGPPSLLVVGGSDAPDGTAFMRRKNRA